MKKDKIIFLDRDGTIIIDKKHAFKIEDMEFLPGTVEGLGLLQELGYALIMVSNQGGIAKKIFTENDALRFNRELISRLESFGVKILGSYFCPHHPEITGPCRCRKPNTGMVEMALQEHKIILENSVVIGDRDIDVELGKNIGAKTFLLKTTLYENRTEARPDFYVNDMREAYEILKKFQAKL